MHLWLVALTRLYWSLVVLLCSATLLVPNRSACSLTVPPLGSASPRLT